MFEESAPRPHALHVIAAIYLFALLLAVTSYGHPFPFLGRFYSGAAGEWLVFADSLICLYLFLGVLKRQRLTVWLMIAYNLFDIVNAWVNLTLIPAEAYGQLASARIAESELHSTTIAAALVLVFITVFLFANRRHFNNRSPYLF